MSYKNVKDDLLLVSVVFKIWSLKKSLLCHRKIQFSNQDIWNLKYKTYMLPIKFPYFESWLSCEKDKMCPFLFEIGNIGFYRIKNVVGDYTYLIFIFREGDSALLVFVKKMYKKMGGGSVPLSFLPTYLKICLKIFRSSNICITH